MEELVAPLGDVVLGEGGDQFHRFQSTTDLFRSRRGVPQDVHELIEDPYDLRGAFIAMIKEESLVSHKEQHARFGLPVIDGVLAVNVQLDSEDQTYGEQATGDNRGCSSRRQ